MRLLSIGLVAFFVLAPCGCSADGRAIVVDGAAAPDGSPSDALDGSPSDARSVDALARCPDGLALCGDTCVDLATDLGHCGACDAVCNSGVWPGYHDVWCEAGECKHGTMKDCNGGWTDPYSDNNNCGDCDIKCDVAHGLGCVAGTCSCVPVGTVCSGVCVDLDTDPSNCGDCAVVCPDGHNCHGGECDPCACPSELTCCLGGACVDTAVDPQNCGACGHACDPAQTCVNGCCTIDAALMLGVTCPSATMPCGSSMQCSAARTLPSGAVVDVTADASTTWYVEATPSDACTATITAGLLSVACPTAAATGCQVSLKAAYDDGDTDPCSSPLSGVFLVTVAP